EILDEPQRRLLLMLADCHATALVFVARGLDGFGDAVETLADIDVAEGSPFQRARSLSDDAGSAVGKRQRMLEERHELRRSEAAFRGADDKVEEGAGQSAR